MYVFESLLQVDPQPPVEPELELLDDELLEELELLEEELVLVEVLDDELLVEVLVAAVLFEVEVPEDAPLVWVPELLELYELPFPPVVAVEPWLPVDPVVPPMSPPELEVVVSKLGPQPGTTAATVRIAPPRSRRRRLRSSWRYTRSRARSSDMKNLSGW